jgi:hypothetical protein
MGYNPEQVQDFYPTPSTLSSVMYYTGLDPRTMEPVYVPTDPHEKAMQRALIQYRNPKNYYLVREALLAAHREDLIGSGPKCLIRAVPPRQGKPTAPPPKPIGKKPPAKKPAAKAPAKPAPKKPAPKVDLLTVFAIVAAVIALITLIWGFSAPSYDNAPLEEFVQPTTLDEAIDSKTLYQG